MNTSSVKSLGEWNWDGDTIVPDPIIRAGRKVPDTDRVYDVDIREFLSIEDNAVMRRTLGRIIAGLNESDQVMFRARTPGAFDFRARTVLNYISSKIDYVPRSRKFDTWMFPDETVSIGEGDCEDRVFLLAALLLGSGISGYMVRVVLGKLHDCSSGRRYDHAWVMYKNEKGAWMLLEPFVYSPDARKIKRAAKQRYRRGGEDQHNTGTIEYIPYFLFNDKHLWCVARTTSNKRFGSYVKQRRFWSTFDPEFATSVHNQIYDVALAGMSWADIQWVKAHSLALDSPFGYDPRDHFDNAFIHGGWELVQRRLATKNLTDFAYATHAIADFYAHSSYGHFGPRDASNNLILFADAKGNHDGHGLSIDDPAYDYSTDPFDLHDAQRFSTNERRCQMASRDAIIAAWNGKIISGRFAQPRDPHQGTWERHLFYIPSELLDDKKDFAPRYCLPHHNEIAVDNVAPANAVPDGHKLYRNHNEYTEQFALRREAAIHHIKEVYLDWKQQG